MSTDRVRSTLPAALTAGFALLATAHGLWKADVGVGRSVGETDAAVESTRRRRRVAGGPTLALTAATAEAVAVCAQTVSWNSNTLEPSWTLTCFFC